MGSIKNNKINKKVYVLQKYSYVDFKGFDWLNFDYLPDSHGFKFEIHLPESSDLVSKSIISFYIIFRDFLSEILISTFNPKGKWGNFCIDTWSIANDMNDYSPNNKQEPTASYLKMLMKDEIQPQYSGFCKCHNWDEFLYITFNCVVRHKAPYSMMFYVPKKQVAFYFHHSGSFGVYYKELTKEIKILIQNSLKECFVISNTNDERVDALLVDE